jgi:hypothetical protein
MTREIRCEDFEARGQERDKVVKNRSIEAERVEQHYRPTIASGMPVKLEHCSLLLRVRGISHIYCRQECRSTS